MALYHFHVTQVSRGAGQSSVASAAYRAGEKLHDSYYGETHDYTRSEIAVEPSDLAGTIRAGTAHQEFVTSWN